MSEAFDPYYTWLGIHPEDQPPDHYRLLGLRTFEENPDVISNAADRQMMMVRTFQSGPRAKQSQQILNQISTAKVCLLNPQQKSNYDRQLAAAAGVSRDSSPAARPVPKPAAPRKTSEPAATMPTPTPQIVVTSDDRPTTALPTIAQRARQRPAWQRPAAVGSAAAVLLALIVISAITLAVSSNNKTSPPISPSDTLSADSPADLADIETQNFAASNTAVAEADQSAKLADDNAFTPPPEVQPAPSALNAANAAVLPPDDTRVADSNSPIVPRIAAPAGSTFDVEPTGKSVDLLALIDTDRDVKRGRFIRRDNGLICVAGAMHIPYRLPDEYVLTAEVARVQENDAMIVGLWIAGRPCLHLIDGFISDGTLCGLELVDNQRVPQNPTRQAGQLLTEDEPATIVYTVRQNQLTVTVDGKTVTRWDGDPNRLSWYSFFKEPKDRNLYIGSWASAYRFSKLELLPLGGGAAATPVAGATAGELGEPVERLAVPDAEKQKVVLGQVQEIFKDEYQAATTADGRMALVEKLVEQCGEAGLDAAAKFVLLSEAYKYAAEAVQPDRAFQAADQLGRQFDVDPLDLKIKAVGDMDKAAWDADSRKRVATAAMAVSRQCLLDDRAAAAEKLSELAEDAATRSRDAELRIEMRTWHADVRQFVKQWTAAEAAKKVLATKPDDAEANTQLGKFLCLTMDDWKKGLPHLVKTDRANVRQLAEMELAAPQAATDQVELADAWWDAAKPAVSDEKDAYQRRARHWYQAALTELAGLQKIKVEKRLETLGDLGEPLLVARSEVAPEHVAASAPPLAVAPFAVITAKRHQQAWANHLGLPVEKDVDLPGGTKLTMILIPPGEFLMGTSEVDQTRLLEEARAANDGWSSSRIRNEGPQRRVRITQPFYLGKYEVTQAQWQAVMGRNPSYFKDQPTHPVETVSWDAIQAFLTKLNEKPPIAQMQFALPTEAQWEYACRAGTTRYWYSGDSEEDLKQYAWFKANTEGEPHQVGELKPNAFELCDLHGNVWEWCADWYAGDYYVKAPLDDPNGPSMGVGRVTRGGAWAYEAAKARSACRDGVTPSFHDNRIGFRLAVVLPDK